MIRNILILACILTFVPASETLAQRTEHQLKSWRFTHDDKPSNAMPECDDTHWQAVSVPHDWAISGPFDAEIDKQVVAIEQNGEKEATEKTGRSGALPWIGTGWYRTTAVVSPAAERVLLNFDGAMAEPEVYVNGRKAGEWKYGYSAFNIDITDHINRNGSENTIAVRLQNIEESSRWYPGAGLYRPVTLIETGRTAIAQWGVNVQTLSIDADGTVSARFTAETENYTGRDLAVEFDVQTESRHRTVFSSGIDADGTCSVIETFGCVVPWSPEEPKLYNLTVSLYDVADGKKTLLDSVTKRVGFRTVKCSAERGFELNGVSRKIRGVCLHHDLGMLGAAVNKAALIRQIELLKTMGCDAIRTAHNMPSQMQMDVCDSLGVMVMVESFDMWVYPKCKNGYARFFKEWADRDIRNLVLANRLHPSNVMWSVGNEIPEQWSAEGAKILRHLQDEVRKYDATLPITNGMDKIEAALKSGFAQVTEVPGMNYRTHLYQKAYDGLGHGFVLGSETASTVSSRGVYKFPVERRDNHAYNDGQCSSYDTEACWWANVPEDDWLLQDEKPWVIGEFVWTGFDYLGEPTPYDEYWPSRSSYFGIFDLAGLPKDRYYLYRSRWNSSEETIHLLPHWNWQGREGEVTPVYCYTNYPSAELFINGKSQGRRAKRADVKSVADKSGRIKDIHDPAFDRYRLRWNDVVYEPGEVKVVCYDAAGNVAGEKTICTAGKPAALRITTDELLPQDRTLRADSEDMLFLTVSATDKNGNVCPLAQNDIAVTVKGAAMFRGICNGDATSLEVFTQPKMKLFNGKLVIGIQSKDIAGSATVTVRSRGLKKAEYKIDVKAAD